MTETMKAAALWTMALLMAVGVWLYGYNSYQQRVRPKGIQEGVRRTQLQSRSPDSLTPLEQEELKLLTQREARRQVEQLAD